VRHGRGVEGEEEGEGREGRRGDDGEEGGGKEGRRTAGRWKGEGNEKDENWIQPPASRKVLPPSGSL